MSSCIGSGASPFLTVVLAPGQDLPQQSLPVDPSGVVYDSGLRQPVPGSIVSLEPVGACAGWNPATGLVGADLGGYAVSGGRVSMTVGIEGFYQFLFAPAAPASCTWRIAVTPPPGYSFVSTAIPPAAGPLVPPGGRVGLPGSTAGVAADGGARRGHHLLPDADQRLGRRQHRAQPHPAGPVAADGHLAEQDRRQGGGRSR